MFPMFVWGDLSSCLPLSPRARTAWLLSPWHSLENKHWKYCSALISTVCYCDNEGKSLPRRFTISLTPGYFLSRKDRVAFWNFFLIFILKSTWPTGGLSQSDLSTMPTAQWLVCIYMDCTQTAWLCTCCTSQYRYHYIIFPWWWRMRWMVRDFDNVFTVRQVENYTLYSL